MGRVLLKALVVEDSEGKVLVKLGVTDEHVANCPSCMAMFALRFSAAFLNAIEEMQSDAEEDDADEQNQHALH